MGGRRADGTGRTGQSQKPLALTASRIHLPKSATLRCGRGNLFYPCISKIELAKLGGPTSNYDYPECLQVMRSADTAQNLDALSKDAGMHPRCRVAIIARVNRAASRRGRARPGRPGKVPH